MNVEVLSEFYRMCGHSVFRSASAWWYDAHPRFLMSVPYQREISLEPGELEEIFRSRRSVFGARYFGPETGVGRRSFLIVCKDKQYDLNKLPSKTRRQTRYGLEH